MKKITALFFLCIFLFSTTEAHQLLKLPVVFQHFHEHQGANKNMSLLEFLDMHYMHASPKDADHDRDMQLPFKTSSDCLSFISPAFIPFLNLYSIPELPALDIKKTFTRKNQFILSAYLSNIWQPPRIS